MKDYKENKSNLSETFCNEVYSVVREIPARLVLLLMAILPLCSGCRNIHACGACLEAGACRFKPPLSSGSQCHRPISARMGRAAGGCWMPKVFLSVKMDV